MHPEAGARKNVSVQLLPIRFLFNHRVKAGKHPIQLRQRPNAHQFHPVSDPTDLKFFTWLETKSLSHLPRDHNLILAGKGDGLHIDRENIIRAGESGKSTPEFLQLSLAAENQPFLAFKSASTACGS